MEVHRPPWRCVGAVMVLSWCFMVLSWGVDGAFTGFHGAFMDCNGAFTGAMRVHDVFVALRIFMGLSWT